MNLHEDNDAFSELVTATAQDVGLPEIYIEKDYWVSYALRHLSLSQYVDEVVFKGGTSLSKAYRIIDRFSEDIDLAILASNCSDNIRKRKLKSVEREVSQGLISLDQDIRTSKGSTYRKTVYQYPRRVAASDFGQASTELLIEINAFTHPEPFERCSLQSFIAEMLSERGEQGLISWFGLEPFDVNVLSVKRTLVEKLLGMIKDSYHPDPSTRLAGRIRHLYDICLILRHKEYRQFVEGTAFAGLCASCIEDEKAGFLQNEHLFDTKLSEALLFNRFADWQAPLETTYNTVFSQLVYGELPNMDEIAQSLVFLKKNLISNGM